MQLRLALVLLVSSVTGVATAQPQSSARVRGMLYQDDDNTTVGSAAVEAQAAIADTVVVRAGYLVDAISTASVDVVAAATQRWDERRDELRAGVDLHISDVVVSTGYVRSTENDYDSHRITAGTAISLADRATTLSIGGGLILSNVGRASDPSFEADQTIYAGSVGLTQVLSRTALGSVGYNLQYVDGYQASPYRFIRADRSFVAERHPMERWRHALTGRLRYAISDDITLGVDERLYYDSWEVFGTTTVLRVTFQVSKVVDLAIRDRFHFQTAASFYSSQYEQQMQFMTVDRELSSFIDNYAGLALGFTAKNLRSLSSLRFDVSADFFVYHFFDHPWITDRIGTLVQVGMEGVL